MTGSAGDGPPVTFARIDPGSAEAVEVLGRYYRELAERFPEGFDPDDRGYRGGIADGGGAAGDRPPVTPATATTDRGDGPEDSVFVIMRHGDAVVGCGTVGRLDGRTSEIKRMWVDGSRRGRGLGRRLLTELEDVSRRLGRTRIVLDTNESLTEARSLYERAGYRQIERYNANPYAHHWFAKELAPGP